jgi:hypothetical protein
MEATVPIKAIISKKDNKIIIRLWPTKIIVHCIRQGQAIQLELIKTFLPIILLDFLCLPQRTATMALDPQKMCISDGF